MYTLSTVFILIKLSTELGLLMEKIAIQNFSTSNFTRLRLRPRCSLIIQKKKLYVLDCMDLLMQVQRSRKLLKQLQRKMLAKRIHHFRTQAQHQILSIADTPKTLAEQQLVIIKNPQAMHHRSKILLRCQNKIKLHSSSLNHRRPLR